MHNWFCLQSYLEEPEEGGDTANVENVGSDAHNVVQNTGQFTKQNPK